MPLDFGYYVSVCSGSLAYPYLDPETPVLDAVLQRAKSDGAHLVMVAGPTCRLRRCPCHRCAGLPGLEVRDYLFAKEANGVEYLLVLRRPDGTQ